MAKSSLDSNTCDDEVLGVYHTGTAPAVETWGPFPLIVLDR